MSRRRPQPLDLARQRIAAAPHGLDELRPGRVLLDLLAQAAHQIVDCAIEDVGLAPAHHVEQPVAAHHLTRVAHQRVPRSEEHTSEPQSLMRSSYAVYCMKKTRQK